MSTDRRWIAVALSESGNTQIYLLSADGTPQAAFAGRANGIDTEPTFSPNNEEIAFVSDSGGSPQIYLRNRLSGEEKRLTFWVFLQCLAAGFHLMARCCLSFAATGTEFNVHIIDPGDPGQRIGADNRH